MAVSPELRDFVRQGLVQGHTRADIERTLAAAGWPRDQVRAAVGSFAAVDFPVPVPAPTPYTSAREAFQYLVLFSTLYLCAFNFGALLFNLIDIGLHDPEVPMLPLTVLWDNIRWNVALLVVAFPVFAYMARRTTRELRLEPGKRGSKVHRWLTYLTLFVAGSILLGDLTGLVHGLLADALTLRFVLKVLTVGVVAGSVFRYNLADLRYEDEPAGAGEPVG